MNPSDIEITIDQIADSFAERIEAGERPSIEEYKQKYPQLAERIEAVLPALIMLGNVESQPDPRKLAFDDSIPQVLGEYEIVQEIGRGGMGIVFEAQHMTMRRRVALKVLPKSSAEKSNYLQRFLTEARSAGQLHHTNIVPVFEVGDKDGIHFYAMQFIHGDNLDRVIEDVKRIREATDREATQHHAAENSHSARSHRLRPNVSESIAEDLVHGISSARTSPDPPQAANSASIAADSENPSGVSTRAKDSTFSQNSIDTAGTRSLYHQRVATVGFQVAEALEHAHSHGVLHRDVKPANLILDTDGNVWVTDFGLAKMDSDDLTHTGDIIGTLRYMAPERFEGKADARSDVFSLGLTLYELCTLKYAFSTDQANRIRDAESRSTIAPRKLDESIPADLETIILKAIESQPERRYQSAGEMADDLRLFLADRPIKARRVSWLERSWRVCRRNPVAASMAGCIMLLLAVLALGSLQFAIVKGKQTAAEVKLRRESQRGLYDSKVDQAQMRRYSQRLGQRNVAIDAIKTAMDLLPNLGLSPKQENAERLKLRNEALGALTLTDLEEQDSFTYQKSPLDVQLATFDPNYKRYAELTSAGDIRIARRSDDETLSLLTDIEYATWVLMFSPDGEYLSAKVHPPNAPRAEQWLYVWKITDPKPLLRIKGVGYPNFSSDSRKIAFSTVDGITIQELEGPFESTTFSPEQDDPSAITNVRFSKDDRQIAITKRNSGVIEFWDIQREPRLVKSLEVEDNIYCIDWDSERNFVAVGTARGVLYYWQGDLDQTPRSVDLHQNTIIYVFFHPSRDLIATTAWDGTSRLTDLVSGREALRISGDQVLRSGFSPQGELGFSKAKRFGVWKISDPILEVFSSSGRYTYRSRFHPSYPQLIAMTTDEGIEYWDIETRRLVHFSEGTSTFLEFTQDGQQVFTSGEDGLFRSDLSIEPSSNDWEIRIGTPELIADKGKSRFLLTDEDQSLLYKKGNWVKKLDLASGKELARYGPHSQLNSFSLSADKQRLLTSTWHGKGVGVWNMETGAHEQTVLENAKSVRGIADPVDPNCFYTIGTSLHRWTFENSQQSDWNFKTIRTRFLVSSDSDTVAASRSAYDVFLVDSQTGQELASIDTVGPSRIVSYLMSPDGNKMAITCFDNLQVLDIRKARAELKKLGLDWSTQLSR